MTLRPTSGLKAIALALAAIWIAGSLPAELFEGVPVSRTDRYLAPADLVSTRVTNAAAWLDAHPRAAQRLADQRHELEATGFIVKPTPMVITQQAPGAHARPRDGWWRRLTTAKADSYAYDVDMGWAVFNEMDDGDDDTAEYSFYVSTDWGATEVWGNVQFVKADPYSFWTWGEGMNSSGQASLAAPPLPLLTSLCPSLAAAGGCQNGHMTYVSGKAVAHDAFVNALEAGGFGAMWGCYTAAVGYPICVGMSFLMMFAVSLSVRAVDAEFNCHGNMEPQP